MTSRTLKWTTFLILLCITFFLGSFNATLRILVDQRKEISQTKKKHKPNQLSDGVNFDPTTTLIKDDPASIAFQKIAQKQLKYAELKNPTIGKYRSFSRQLDEFPDILLDDKHSSHFDSNKSFKRQDQYHYKPPHTNSTHTIADAHFAKALRMLSSPFDKLENGGNALPPKLYNGRYHQEKRGEKFVRMNWLKKKRKRKTDSGREDSKRRKFVSSSLRDIGLPDWYLDVVDTIESWYQDALVNLYDILGVEMDTEETTASIVEGRTPDNPSGSDRGRNEEDVFSWSDTRVGSQLIRMYEKIVSLWTRHPKSEYDSKSSSDDGTTKELMSKEDHLAIEGLYHLEKAAELGHAEAQRMVANSLASGILPLSDHSLIKRYAKWQHVHSKKPSNLTALLAKTTLEVPDDFASGGEQLSRAMVLWHMSAMDGNVESAMALGFRHLYSATGGTTLIGDTSDDVISPGYSPTNGGSTDIHGTSLTSHYGVLGTCPTALAYYEAAANGVMDELESGPTKGKVAPPIDEHRLAQIHMRGGASVALEHHNKPDEIEEALQYYRMLASRNRSPQPDLNAAYTIANFYHLGLRGVKQDLRLALKYYEICGDYNHWEGGGLAGLFHVWGIGMRPEERDLGKAFAYFQQGTPGGIEGCAGRIKQRKKAKDNDAEEFHNCDRYSANGMGLISLLGIDGLVDRSVANARKWFEIAKDLGDPDGQFNYAMLRLGWMVTETYNDYSAGTTDPTSPYFNHGNPSTTPQNLNYLVYRRHKSTPGDTSGPSVSDFSIAVAELSRAASKGHIQAKHRLGMLYATGAEVYKNNGKAIAAVKQSCMQALQYYKSIADSGHTISMRNRAAWKQYNNGDYESALRNYLATAESGSVAGQMNAAFLLERGYCLGMATDECTRASIRQWRVAARQGSLEACLRVGDFYFYGRMKKHPIMSGDAATDLFDEDTASHERNFNGKALHFAPGPYRWARYLLYPEEGLSLAMSWMAQTIKKIPKYLAEEKESDATCSAENDALGICRTQTTDDDQPAQEEDQEHMSIAAQYYRKAAEDHKSARANFNLGFMYEWGLGLNQDFPLAKRHYDLAREEADLAASLALFAMGIHEKALKFCTRYLS